MTDAGMCGDYDSVIGMTKGVPVARFTRKLPTERMAPADGPATLCGLFVETDDTTGLARCVRCRFARAACWRPSRPSFRLPRL